jgi:hypothetical protein
VVAAQEGARRGDRRDLLEAFPPEQVGERRKAAAFGVGEAKPAATALDFEDAVFLKEIREDLLLVTLNLSSEHGQEQWKNHRLASGWR